MFADYSATNLTFHVGGAAGETLSVTVNLTIEPTTTTGAFSVALRGIDVAADADQPITDVDTLIADVSSVRTLGGTQNRLEHTIANLSVAVDPLGLREPHP